MIRSMTGFGKGRAAEGSVALAAQVRSVNARGREIRLRLPQELFEAEDGLRQKVQDAIARGRVDVVVDWDGAPPQAPRFALNEAGAAAMLDIWRRVREAHGLPGEPTTDVLLRLPGVVESLPGVETDTEALGRVAARALAHALEAHRAAREREGARLAEDLAARSATIARLVSEIAGLVADAAPRAAALLRERVAALLGEATLDEQRLAQEVALLAQRADVTEELVRLRSHLQRLDALFAPGAEEIGRTLEFLVQEIRREVTTIGSKTGSPEIDGRTLAIKAELERLREQSANLE